MLLVLAALAHADPPRVDATLDAPAPAGETVGGIPADVAQAIWQIELLRLAPVTLSGFVADADPRVRARASDALGRLRSPDSVVPLATLLEDPDPEVRARAAFALGQTPGGDVPLARRWPAERAPSVRARIAVALGKQGGPEAMDALLSAVHGSGLLPGPVVLAAVEGLGRLGTRQVSGANADRVVAALLDVAEATPIGDTRRRAAWALARMGLSETSPDNAMRLRALALSDGDALVRAWALRAWSGVTTDAARLDGLAAAARDPEAGVRIAAARGLARHSGPGVSPILAQLLADRELAVRLEAISAVGDAARATADPRPLLLPSFASADPVERAAALRALAKRDALPGPAADWTVATEPLLVRIAAVEALTDRNRLLYFALRAPEAPIRSAAATVLLETDPPRTEELVALLGAEDGMLAGAAANKLVDHPDPLAEAPLLRYVQRDGIATEAAIEGVKALRALYDTGRLPRPGKDAAKAIRPWLRHPAIEADAERLAALLGVAPPVRRHPARRLPLLAEVQKIRSARIFTTRGELRVQLFPEDAPYTVWNFAQLAEDGYYDGIAFHRAVPDFVIQAGCPRGDGWGGPGYEIPDEISPRSYETGAVGMALSGPDTGGSQWFVTLSPQPHLDGTYTLFGRVTLGLREAWAVQVGDVIERIEIERVP